MSLHLRHRNAMFLGHCVLRMSEWPASSVDLCVCDPPYNIGYDYHGEYADNLTPDAYKEFSRQWIGQVYEKLKPGGAFWLIIGDDWAADLQVLAREIGFVRRKTVVWYFTFGVNQVANFTSSHTQLLYFVKPGAEPTFNAPDPACRVPSARQLIYKDKRANPLGRLPDDTWILRPQDVPDGFAPTDDTWHIPRVAGTHKERQLAAPTQLPEQLVGRIIRLCSKLGELVLDPMCGMGTVPVVAKKLGRDYLGCDQAEKFVLATNSRLSATTIGQPLAGDVM